MLHGHSQRSCDSPPVRGIARDVCSRIGLAAPARVWAGLRHGCGGDRGLSIPWPPPTAAWRCASAPDSRTTPVFGARGESPPRPALRCPPDVCCVPTGCSGASLEVLFPFSVHWPCCVCPECDLADDPAAMFRRCRSSLRFFACGRPCRLVCGLSGTVPEANI